MAQDESTAAGLARWVPSLPTNLISTLNPFANDTSSTDAHLVNGSATPPAKRQSLLAAILPASPSFSLSGQRPTQYSQQHTAQVKQHKISTNRYDAPILMFAEPDNRSGSDNSREGSTDGARTRSSAQRTPSRPKTSFSICHPPPASTTRQRLSRRPRALLQLHKLSASSRPRPAFEVVASANLSSRVTSTLAARAKPKNGMYQPDMLVLRAENYAPEETAEDDVGSATSSDREKERDSTRDAVAVICRGKKEDDGSGSARLCLADGADWEAYSLSNGGYEFITVDEHGLGWTVRWWPKKGKDGSRSKFNFSTISPNSRRHPIIASLSRTGLHINDTYRMPITMSPRSTPNQTSTVLADAMEEEEEQQQEQYETDAQLRELILVSGIWVLFREGWSPNARYEERDSASMPQSPISHPRSPTKSGRTASPMSTPPASPALSPLEKRASVKSISSSLLRRQSLLSTSTTRAHRLSQASVTEESVFKGDNPQCPSAGSGNASSQSLCSGGRTRANSQSTVLVNRASGGRRDIGNTALRPDLLAAQQVRWQREGAQMAVTPTSGTPSAAVTPTVSTAPSAIGDDTDGRAQSIGDLKAKPTQEPETSEADEEEEPDDIEDTKSARTDSQHASHSSVPPRPIAVPAPGADSTPPRLRLQTSMPLPPPSQRQSHAPSTATNTDTSDPASAKAPKTRVSAAGRKRRGLRRLLCGSGADS